MKIIRPSGPQGIDVIMFNVAHRLQDLKSLGVRVPSPDDTLFRTFQGNLFQAISGGLPVGSTLISLDMMWLTKTVHSFVMREIAIDGHDRILTSSPDLAPVSKGRVFNLNRIFNRKGEIIGYGPRPGCEHLDIQLRKFKEEFRGKPIILVEQGSFTGGTILFTLFKLRGQGISVSKIVVGFCSEKVKHTIEQRFEGTLIVVNEIERLIDWITDVDLFPFAPGSGRVIGRYSPNGLVPLQTRQGHGLCIPYSLPFGDARGWLSLPPRSARLTSAICLDTAVTFFSRVEEENRVRLSVGELVSAPGVSKICLPIVMGTRDRPPMLKERVVDVLASAREKLG